MKLMKLKYKLAFAAIVIVYAVAIYIAQTVTHADGYLWGRGGY
jgi:hypothetical protein